MESFSFFWIVVLFLCLITSLGQFALGGFPQLVHCNAADREALFDFKMGLNDSSNRLSSWQGTNCCQWWGIACDNTTGAVVAIDFAVHSSGMWQLGGEIRPSLAKLKSLRYLDLSGNTFSGKIPDFLSSLENLQYLNMSNSGLSGEIPPNIGNISSLHFLDVSASFGLTLDNLEWVSGLVSLKYLSMDYVDLSKVGVEWVEAFSKLPFLSELHLRFCGLSGFIYSLPSVNFTSLAVLELEGNSFNSKLPNWVVNISSLIYVNMENSLLKGRIPLGFGEIPNLQTLELNFNSLSASCFQLLKGNWKKIQVLDLSLNNLHGKLPTSLGNLTSLTYFNLHRNSIEGGIPSSIGRISNLEYIDLSFNSLIGGLPNSLGQLKNLVELHLTNNLLQGPIPDSIRNLQCLDKLSLASNKLNGTVPISLGLLSELSLLDISINELTGVISEAHFLRLGKVKEISMSGNSFVMNLSSNWVPPFQVNILGMGSSHLGPSFPAWLRTQKEIQVIDFSSASISGSIPNWFWNMSGILAFLNVSFNHLEGHIPNTFNITPYANVDFSSNHFKGPIPLPNVLLLDLSNNQFSDPIPNNIGQIMPLLLFLSLSGNQLIGEIPVSIAEMPLDVLDLSRNNLTGSIPPSIGNCSSLTVLDLRNNNLSSGIPRSIGHLSELRTLHLSNNRIYGEIPSSLRNLSKLETLDLGNNRLIGKLPSWIGEAFPSLRIISLRSNKFSGEIPLALSNLSSLQILDLSGNQLNGSIPSVLCDLKAMAQQQNVNHYLLYGTLFEQHYFQENIYMTVNGLELHYTKTLSLLTSIDLSGNNFHGKLPEEITKLVGLEVLNLSRNHISGQIPENISKLHQLLSLDLSGNKLSGSIPPSMSSMSFLGYLNLSNNHLSGKIPHSSQMTTFSASSFGGNSGLCGDPLALKCPNDDSNNGKNDGSDGGGRDEEDDGNGFIDKWFYMSIGLGFAVGLLLPYLIFTMKRSWGGVYFALVDRTVYELSSEKNKAAIRRRRRTQRSS